MLSTSLFRCICSQGRPNSEAISTKDGSAFLRRTPLRRPRRVGGAWSPSSCAKRRSDSAVTGSSAVTLAQIHSTWVSFKVSFNLQGYQKQTPIGPQENRISTKLNYTAANHKTVLSVRMSRFLSGTLHGDQKQTPIPAHNPSCKAQLSTIESSQHLLQHKQLVCKVQHRSTPIPSLQPSCDEKQSTMDSSSCSFRRVPPSRLCGSPNIAHSRRKLV